MLFFTKFIESVLLHPLLFLYNSKEFLKILYRFYVSVTPLNVHNIRYYYILYIKIINITLVIEFQKQRELAKPSYTP